MGGLNRYFAFFYKRLRLLLQIVMLWGKSVCFALFWETGWVYRQLESYLTFYKYVPKFELGIFRFALA